jgi:hypothetical protein
VHLDQAADHAEADSQPALRPRWLVLALREQLEDAGE